MIRLLLSFSLLALVALPIWGCSGGSSSILPPTVPVPTAVSTVVFPIAVPQADPGQQLTLRQPPARIVSLSQSATAILCEGAANQLVAVETHANCPAGSTG